MNGTKHIENKRVIYMDVAKGITIILVVIGHSGSPFYNFIYLFHIPLFFFVSGYFFKDIYLNNPVLFIKKRIKSLYVPFLTYGFIFLLLHNIFYKYNIYSNKVSYSGHVITVYSQYDYFHKLLLNIQFIQTEQLLGAFWFLPCLFVVSALFIVISLICKYVFRKYAEYARLFITILCFIKGMYVSHIHVHFILYGDIALVAILLYYAGYLYRKNEHLIKFNIYYLLLAFFILVMSSFYGHIEMSSNAYPSAQYFLINSFAGIYFIFYCSKFISSHLTSPHLTSPHLTSPHLTSPHLT